MSESAGRPWGAQFLFTGGIIAVLLLFVSAVGTRFGLWGFQIGLFGAMAAGALGFLLTLWGLAVLAFVVLARRRTAYPSLFIGLALASLITVVMGMNVGLALTVPPIHDITTDPADPPAFQAVVERRGADANSLDYDREALEPAQQRAYPWLAPARLPLPAEAAFATALETARRMNWEIVAADAASGRIEATDRSFWFGFADDVVIRLRPDGQGVRVDLRSVSRVGQSDLGANAYRIRRYLEALPG